MLHVDDDTVSAGAGPDRKELDNVVEYRDKGPTYLGAAETVDVKVERKVEELQVVGHRPEHLEAQVFVVL